MPPLPLFLSPHTCRCRHACIRGYASKVMFFFFFFRFFSDHCRDLFSPHAGSSNPHLSTVPRPSSLASPAAAIASFAGTQVKICLFLFFFFRSFSDQCYRPSLPHTPGPQTPASPPHNPHLHALPIKPRKSPPPPPPRRTQAVTSASPLRHGQVRCHHPVTAATLLRRRPNTAYKPDFDANPPRENLATAPPQRAAQVPPHTSPATACKPTTTPTQPAKTSPRSASPATPTLRTRAPPLRQPAAHEPLR